MVHNKPNKTDDVEILKRKVSFYKDSLNDLKTNQQSYDDDDIWRKLIQYKENIQSLERVINDMKEEKVLYEVAEKKPINLANEILSIKQSIEEMQHDVTTIKEQLKFLDQNNILKEIRKLIRQEDIMLNSHSKNTNVSPQRLNEPVIQQPPQQPRSNTSPSQITSQKQTLQRNSRYRNSSYRTGVQSEGNPKVTRVNSSASNTQGYTSPQRPMRQRRIPINNSSTKNQSTENINKNNHSNQNKVNTNKTKTNQKNKGALEHLLSYFRDL